MQVEYKVIRSARKTLALQIHPDGSVIVRAPLKMPLKDIETFLAEKSAWIEKHLNKAKQCSESEPFTHEEIRKLADAALADIPQRVRHYAPIVGVTYGRITIRNQRSRWGSCSSKGNLNFNCLLMLCPEEVQEPHRLRRQNRNEPLPQILGAGGTGLPQLSGTPQMAESARR